MDAPTENSQSLPPPAKASGRKKQLAERDRLINVDTVKTRIEAFKAEIGDCDALKQRQALLTLLKEVVQTGRARAEALLLEDGSGIKCAKRLSSLQDTIIEIIHEFAIKGAYRVDNPSSAERMAVVAVGGYGRGTLAPGSDIDLLFVLPYKQTPWGESLVEFILYMLWDLNFKVGHATRDIDECIRLSKQDMTIRTSIVEARFLIGDLPLFEELEERFFREVIAGTSAEFIEAKMAERDTRHRKTGGTRYLVEPNIKEGKGGLRDLHTLFWIAKYFYRVKTVAELAEFGIFSANDLQIFKKSEDFLWAVRCHLHYLTGRPEERLTFDRQREMAQRLNYRTDAGMQDVERFMKHYFLIARNVGNLTNILSAKLEEEQVKAAPGLSRLIPASVGRRRRKISDSDAFLIEKKRIVSIDESVFERDPVNLLRVFEIADKTGNNLHPDLVHLIARSLKLINGDLRTNEEANRIFLNLLTSRRDPEAVLRKMNEYGVLGRFIPDFGKVVAMMQFNMYHHYTVDEHTLRTIGFLSALRHGDLQDDHPLAAGLINQIDDPLVLYVALFVHDIAKGRPEDHSIAGARIARRLGQRMKLKPAQIETTAWLVLEHLTMSMTAQSRDLGDPKTIRDFANVVQTPERLKLLLVFTVCDIRGVGPGVWNGWKGQLLRTLYYQTETLLTGGHSAMPLADQMERAKEALSGALVGWDEAAKAQMADRHYPAYLVRTDLETQVRHAELAKRAESQELKLATDIRTLAFEGFTELTVFCLDHPNMLSILAGSCARVGADIVGAQIYTTRDGFALDTVNLKREFSEDADELRRAERIVSEIEKSLLQGAPKKAREGVVISPVKRSTKAFSVQTEIVVNNTLSNQFTVIEASGKDRPGLLYDLAEALVDLSLGISSAHIATFGERAVDVFYVTDLMGQKVLQKSRQNTIKRRLAKAFAAEGKTTRKVA